ncbi:MAG: Rieske 2Fe-2S domain-containing protein [Candidatus Hodarchaeota archaeon]
MIWNQWHAVLESKEVKNNRIIGVTRMGEKLVFWRDKDGEIACLWDKCAHRGVALSIGKIIDGEIQCPFHGLQYDGTGKCTVIPSRGRATEVPENFKVHQYPARDRHGMIWIWWGDPLSEYPPLPFFENIDKSFDYATHVCRWSVHYSRAIENQLDVSHLPFVHHDTIGRGGKTVCDGPYVEANEVELKAWVMNRKDDGTPSLLPKDVNKPKGGVKLHFKYPNVWQLDLSPDGKVVAFFTPVDEENTVIYLRFYQKFVKIPGLKQLITRLSMLFNNKVLHQDRHVVLTEIPKKTAYKMKENLFPADKPIMEYRRYRHELKEKNKPVTA